MSHNIPSYRKSIPDQVVRAMSPHNHAFTTIDSDHRVIHDGRGFSLSLEGSLAAAASDTLMVVVPEGTYMHWRFGSIGTDDTPFNVVLHDSVVTSADGTEVTTIRNNNRASAMTSDCTVYSGPTITDAGAQLLVDTIRGGAAAGQQASAGLISDLGAEWIFTNTKVTLQITNNSGGTAGYTGRFFWYEIDANYTADL